MHFIACLALCWLTVIFQRSGKVLQWYTVSWYELIVFDTTVKGITIVLCDFAVLSSFLCSFVFVGYQFFCVCVFFVKVASVMDICLFWQPVC